jgi:hypothetical protein
MELFSHKYGYKPVKSVMQVKSMDADLRNSLWNAVHIFYLSSLEPRYDLQATPNVKMRILSIFLWRDYFKKPIDTIPVMCSHVIEYLRNYFFSCEWYEIYDFLQFLVTIDLDEENRKKFKELCNSMLKRELSGYRFIGDVIAPITSEQEIAEIEEALTNKDSLQTITIHLQSALNLLSDKKSPDYKNSIKESISAIETICKLITKNEKASLSQAIKVITNKIELHSDLQEAFYKLYGYTSDAEGIRHSLMDKPDLDFEDAKFMLVTCSAFVNYLKVKAAKAKIKLEAD